MFIEDRVVRMGLRTISVSEAVDKADTTTWQVLLIMHAAWRNVLRR